MLRPPLSESCIEYLLQQPYDLGISMTLRELAVASSSAKSLESLRGDIVRRYEELSPRLQQVAK